MADENVVINVEFKGNSDGVEESAQKASDAIDKVKKSTATSNNEVGVGETKLKRFFDTFRSGGEVARGSLNGLKTAIASTGIGILVIAAGALLTIFQKLGIVKTIFDKITDAIGLTTIAQDKLAEKQKKNADAYIESLNNQLILLKARGAAETEILNIELLKAKATFEADKALLIAYSHSKKNYELSEKDGELYQKLQKDKAQYFALLAAWNKKRYDEDVDYQNQLALLKLDGIQKELKELDFWFEEKGGYEKMDYALVLLYEAKKKEIRDKYVEKDKKDKEEQLEKDKKDNEEKLKKFAADYDAYNAWYIEQLNLEQEKQTKKIADEKKQEKEKLDLKQQLLENDYILKEEKDQEYYDRKREIEIERVNLEIEDEEKRQAALAEIDLRYQKDQQDRDKETAEKKKREQQQVYDALLSTVNSAAGAVGSIWNSQMQEELKNEKLSEKEKEKIKKKYFEREKKLALVMAVINGASAAIKFLSDPGGVAGIVLSALSAVTTAAEIAVISSQKYALGGKIKGPSHTNGGVPIIAEGGEFVVNARTMSNPELASTVIAANNAGNGMTSTPAVGLTKEELTSAIINGIVAIPIYIDEEGSFKTYKLGKKVETRESKYIK